MEAADAAVSFGRRAGVTVLIAAAALLLAACGSSSASPRVDSAAERQWVANAGSLIGTLESDVLMSTVGGANLATARRALTDDSDVMTMLVAYDLFGDCGRSLANAGTPAPQASGVVQTLIAACSRLERASTLFQEAMTRRVPRPLLAASREVLTAEPLLERADSELAALRSRSRG